MLLDVRRLRLLYELSRRGTLGAVATAMHVSQSSVSQRLAQLEAEAGARQLNHVGRGVRLTEAARMLVAHAEIVIRELELAEARLASFGTDVHGTIRIATFQTVTLALLLPSALRRLEAFAELRAELAQVEPELALSLLLDHDFDLALAEEFGAAPLIGLPELAREDLCPRSDVAGRRPSETERGVGAAAPTTESLVVEPMDLARLSRAPWVMEPGGIATRAWGRLACAGRRGLSRWSGSSPPI